MEKIKLNNGYEIPIVGSGTNTFGKVNNEYGGSLRGDTDEIDMAVANGYTHFDTAQVYFNEEVTGEGLSKSELNREDVFITTKLNTYDGYKGDDWAREEIQTSLDKLQTDYIDLFLIHFPWDNNDEILSAWNVLIEFYNKGIFKAIGVSNFEKEHLELILENSDVIPAVNQIESHVGKWNDDLIAYHEENDIATIAWSPLGGLDDNSRQILDEIGEQYGKTFAQVILRYQIERGVIVIPKSHNKDRQGQSLDIFDFELTEEDKEKIQKL